MVCQLRSCCSVPVPSNSPFPRKLDKFAFFAVLRPACAKLVHRNRGRLRLLGLHVRVESLFCCWWPWPATVIGHRSGRDAFEAKPLCNAPGTHGSTFWQCLEPPTLEGNTVHAAETLHCHKFQNHENKTRSRNFFTGLRFNHWIASSQSDSSANLEHPDCPLFSFTAEVFWAIPRTNMYCNP